MCKYKIDRIPKLHFDSKEIPDFSLPQPKRCAQRITPSQLNTMPAGKDIDALRRKLSEYFLERLSGSYPQLEAKCDILTDTFQKVLRFKGGRNVTYTLLSKFCIGARLSLSETRQMFEYMDYHLTERCLPDYILLCNIENKGDIDEYIQDMKKHCQ